ncbi:GNAT family N-acetyltransferase [Micromonospora sp. 4G55]|uniref:GNAT family N-acetyltransferase n=2 Tax=Micromonospora sp. 4G55 TaxID=2806102 RepID=UPI001A63F5FF|nr:GNAT family N-acetyltransferase [Micromonospora sp. 4G55]MBM0259351.1 GNAT family N-acetyltransferase [Micromonospora sp. 4G55]
MDARIQQSVVANLSSRPAPVEVGPFVIGVDPTTTSPHINYATPRPGTAITAADVTALVAAFRAAGRRPRLEYIVSCAPGLEALLIAAGFVVEARHTYLLCVPGTLQTPPTPDHLELREPGTDSQRAALISAQNEAFGGDRVASAADVARLRRLQAAGGVTVMAATDDGTCAGGGGAVPPTGAVSEVAGIAVRSPYRRQGLAGAITAAITRRLFTTGVEIAWLEASGEKSWRVYERVGYRPAGQRLYIAMD